MSEEIDLSAYPVIRIDQISLLDDGLLEKIDREVNILLTSNDNSNAGLRKYLIKQANAMADEISRRKAFDRVQKLLSGAQDLLTVNYSPIPTPREAAIDHIGEFKRSVVVVKNVEPVRPSMQLERSIQPIPITNSAPNSSSSASSSVEGPSVLPKDIAIDVAAVVSSSSGNEHSFATNDESTPRSIHTARSTTSNSTTGKSRRISSYQQQQQQEENLPSKKSLAIINQNFGNEFIVAATEKKKRFFPQKKPADSNTEEVKRKEKLERRRIAMERLAKRREKQDELKAVSHPPFFFVAYI